VLDPTTTIIVELPPPGAAIVLGLKLTVVPVGAPEAERLIALLNPALTVVVRVEVPWLPAATLSELGEAESKSETPVPESGTVAGELEALLMTEMLPLALPAAVGAKVVLNDAD
jgi:hypothetical protein